MAAYANPELCDGCRGRKTALCREICPSDVLRLDAASQAVNIEPDACWECYACVKACPTTAMQVRGYSDGFCLGASLAPHRDAESIGWEITFRNGEKRCFRFPIRTTAWGSIAPYRRLSPPNAAELHEPGLCGQEIYLGVPQLPRLPPDARFVK